MSENMDGRDPNAPQNSEQSSQTNGTGRSHRRAGGREATNTGTETAEYYQTFLSRLLAVVSHGQPEVVDRLIEIIRSGASQQQIFEALAELAADSNP